MLGSLFVIVGLCCLLTMPVFAADGQTTVQVGFYGSNHGQQKTEQVSDHQIPNGQVPYITEGDHQRRSTGINHWGKLPQTGEGYTAMISLIGALLLGIMTVWRLVQKKIVS